MPFDQEKAAARDDDPVALEDIGRKDDVGDAGFIFEREEDEALGGAGALPGDDAAGDADRAIVAAAQQVVCRENAFAAQGRAMIGHGMRAGGEAGAGVVGGEALVGGHLPERHRLQALRWRSHAAPRSSGPTGRPACFHLPERIAAMLDAAQRVERADAGQRDELLAVERGNAQSKIVDGGESAIAAARREQCFRRGLPQAFRVVQADAQRERAVRLPLPACKAIQNAARRWAARAGRGAAHL